MRAMTDKLAAVPNDTILYPGHLYSPQASAALGVIRDSNPVFVPRNEQEWLAAFG